ncbi:MAG: TraB/GumN family protein [Fibrobacter sp.]|jgi:pheromone shutdown-related protein TraB|uniref:TraB/GumN family protein n=1 Tax=unclassified Fibrobacter TaxID=2634177 RepID=UPI000911945A|nr:MULTISPECIES: TraB/GumN family protein [unclassified Fibrobacter]MBQ3720098.1 TraB/GumN family protein [Fibrobacter sp.]MBQ9226932.1 TraB/GumN family protein [Fibrobacter sp.]MBR2059053.1 TraB/GumN family protein [Fibrobacter sp.]MBR4009018.1 TraB/GumN family protein [Fibrobacter sp.]SHN05466.1 pheromone shutdown-related protein TraB [Fibrobacter sp. UWR3]
MSENADIYRIKTSDDREIVLIGTAHISKVSKELVRETIENEKPDTICVELDEGRAKSIQDPERWKKTDLKEVIKKKQLATLIANLVLGSYQKRMGEQTGVKPGSELKEAVDLASEKEIPVVLADRDIKITLRRTWACTPWYRKFSLLGGLFASIFDKTEISEEELAKIKEQDALNSMMQEFGKSFPEVKQVLIDERDQFLASKIKNAPGQKVVAVVGAGHMKGIAGIIEGDKELPSEESISVIPKGAPIWKIIGWAIPLAIVASIIFVGYKAGVEKAGELSLQWAMLTGGGAMLGTIIAGGHPLTILVALVAAPFTGLTPLIGVGFFTALTQVYMRPPRVSEMETLSDDIWQVKRWWKNRVTRVILCFLCPGIPAIIGKILAIFQIYQAF